MRAAFSCKLRFPERPSARLLKPRLFLLKLLCLNGIERFCQPAIFRSLGIFPAIFKNLIDALLAHVFALGFVAFSVAPDSSLFASPASCAPSRFHTYGTATPIRKRTRSTDSSQSSSMNAGRNKCDTETLSSRRNTVRAVSPQPISANTVKARRGLGRRSRFRIRHLKW